MGSINTLRRYYKSLQCYRLNENELTILQNRRFRKLLNYAVNKSKFYKELYRDVDITKCRLAELPVVTKSAMMNNFDRFVTDPRVKLEKIKNWAFDKKNYGKLFLGEFLPLLTSGSTGEYALVVYHRKALDAIQAALFARHPFRTKPSVLHHLKEQLFSHLLSKFRMSVISVPFGNVAVIIQTAPRLKKLFIKIQYLTLFDPVDHIVSKLNEFKPNCLATSSFFYDILAEEQISGRLNIGKSRSISCMLGAGEPLSEYTKSIAKKAWNLDIQDNYGAVECYFIARSCKTHGNLHLMSDLCILESVDANYNPLPKGEYGEKILITNLSNYTQPIIRYELEDIVGYANQNCYCGLPFPTLMPVKGRKSDFLYFESPKGKYVRFHPYRFRIPLFYASNLRQYQIVQTGRNEITFNYVPQRPDIDIEQELREIVSDVLKKTNLIDEVNLKLRQVVAIPRNKRSGKYEIVKSLGIPSELEYAIDVKTY
jgi:phenylacetate-coenzyme A ligase PaaK-like adenylate-forming protein